MEYANREYERISGKYRHLFRKSSQGQIDTDGTIFSFVRRTRETREQDWKRATQSIINFAVFFNQCGMKTNFEDVNNLDIDILFMTYETLIEQEYQKQLNLQNN